MSLFSKYGANTNFNFAASSHVSNAINLRQALNSTSGLPEAAEMHLLGFNIDANWTAAKLTLLNSMDDGVTFQSVYDATGTEYQMTVVAGGYCLLLPGDLVGLRYVKLQSGTTAATIAQTSAVTLKARLRRFE